MQSLVTELVHLFLRCADLVWLSDKFAASDGSVHDFSSRKFVCERISVVSCGNLTCENHLVDVAVSLLYM